MSAPAIAVVHVAPASSSSVSSAASATRAAPRCAEHPSLFSLADPDPLSIVLSLCLTDLPAALGRPYFPKELVRLVHEYASELSLVVEFESGRRFDAQSFNRVVLAPTQVVQWLAMKLPPTVDASVNDQWADDESDDDPQSTAHCDSCLADEGATIKYGADISRLLHAQLRDNEYRACFLDSGPDEDPELFDPTQYLHDDLRHSDLGEERPFDITQHSRFCIDELNERKAAITARGQEPIAVGLHELLQRVRSSLQAGRLPHGLSPRPCDWAPLFRWIRMYARDMNRRREAHWMNELRYHGGGHEPCECEPLLCALMLQASSSTHAAPVVHQTHARLWAHDQTLPVMCKAAESMMIANQQEHER